jgi:hypothetical protein
MTRATSQSLSEKLEGAGYSHTVSVEADAAGGPARHSIEITRSTHDGNELLTLTQLIVPLGLSVRLDSGKATIS